MSESRTRLRAQDGADASTPSGFPVEDLEQLVAPIALYPDALLTQTLMASTYPLQIVQAQRWVEKNPGVTGAAMEEALKAQDWNPSVKSMCGFAEVLKTMGDNLDWTQDLGDAFLNQPPRFCVIILGAARRFNALHAWGNQPVSPLLVGAALLARPHPATRTRRVHAAATTQNRGGSSRSRMAGTVALILSWLLLSMR